MESAAHYLPSGSPPELPVHWINRAARFVDINGLRVSITDDMATVLDAFLERPGCVVSHDYLTYLLWDDQRRPEPDDPMANLKQKIHGLRKIGLDIRNVRGTGYYLGQLKPDFMAEETGP